MGGDLSVPIRDDDVKFKFDKRDNTIRYMNGEKPEPGIPPCAYDPVQYSSMNGDSPKVKGFGWGKLGRYSIANVNQHYIGTGMPQGRPACFVRKEVVDNALSLSQNIKDADKNIVEISKIAPFTNMNSFDNFFGKNAFNIEGMDCKEADISSLTADINTYKANAGNARTKMNGVNDITKSTEYKNTIIIANDSAQKKLTEIQNRKICVAKRDADAAAKKIADDAAAKKIADDAAAKKIADDAAAKKIADDAAAAAIAAANQLAINNTAAIGFGGNVGLSNKSTGPSANTKSNLSNTVDTAYTELFTNATLRPDKSTTIYGNVQPYISDNNNNIANTAYNYNNKPGNYKIVDIYSNNMPIIEGIENNDQIMSGEKELMRQLVEFNTNYNNYIRRNYGSGGITGLEATLKTQLSGLNAHANAIKSNNVARFGERVGGANGNVPVTAAATNAQNASDFNSIITNHAEIISMRQSLDAKLKELYNTEDSISNDYKKRADSTIYTGILLSAVATSMLYYLFTEM